GNQAAQISVTLNNKTSTFKASSVTQIQAQLDLGDDTITLDESSGLVVPPLSFDGDGGDKDAVIVSGTAAKDAFTITDTQVLLTGAGTLTYSNFESLTVNTDGDTDTGTMTGINPATPTTVDGGTDTDGKDTDSFPGNFHGDFDRQLTLAGVQNRASQAGKHLRAPI